MLRALCLSLLTFLVNGPWLSLGEAVAAGSLHALGQASAAGPCDPFAEEAGGQCLAASTNLVQRNVLRLSPSVAAAASAAAASSQAPAAAGVGPANGSAVSLAQAAACADGHVLLAVAAVACPTQAKLANLPNCRDVAPGQFCEADGECGTKNDLDNCEPWDVYKKLEQKLPEDEVARRAAVALELAENRTRAKRSAWALFGRGRGEALRFRGPEDGQAQATQYAVVGRVVSEAESAEIVAKNGHFWGASRDAWIVLALMVGSIIFSCVTVFAITTYEVNWRASAISAQIEYEDDDDGISRIKEPKFASGWLQRQIFRAELNSGFAYRADLALRAAFACAVIGLSYWVEALKVLNNYGWSMQYVAVILIFTVYMDMGQTVSLAWANFYGTFLPTINVIILFGFFPHGVTETDGTLDNVAWWVGVIDFVCFNGAMLLFNVPVGVRMFALSWEAYFSMCFLNPTDTTKFSSGVRDIVLEGAAMGPLIGTIFGCVLSIIALVPTPIGLSFTGLGFAQETALKTAWAEGEQWKRMITYYTGQEKTLEIDRIVGEINVCRKQVIKLSAQLSNTWWECFDMGRAGRVRVHLLRLSDKLAYVDDWLRGVVQAMQDEDFNDTHDQLMDEVRPQLEKLCKAASHLLYRSVHVAISGFSPSSAKGKDAAIAKVFVKTIQADIKEVNDAQKELAKAFGEARRKLFSADKLTKDAVEEHFFSFALSSFGSYVVDYAEYLLADEVATRNTTGILLASVQGIKDSLSFNSQGFVLRACFSFFTAWLVGYFGISGILPPYSSTAAGTTAFLMAAEGKGGSAVLKNVARFQGVAGGTLLAQLLYSLTMSCTWLDAPMGFAVTLVLEFFAFYLYFASAEYGYVGVLFGCYGAMHMMVSCDTSSDDTSAAVYSTIIDQTLAIVFITIGDLIVQNKSAGTLATDEFCRTSNVFLKAFGTLMDIHDPKLVLKVGASDWISGIGKAAELLQQRGAIGPAARLKAPVLRSRSAQDLSIQLNHREELTGCYRRAVDMGTEAPLEPRFYRLPFNNGLWLALMDSMLRIGTKTCIMEYAVHHTARGAAKSGSVLQAFTNSTETKGTSKLLMSRAVTIFGMADEILKKETEKKLGVDMKAISKKEFLGMDTHIETILADVEKEVPPPEPDVDSLAHDEYCLASVLLLMVSGIMSDINNIEDACFSTPHVQVED